MRLEGITEERVRVPSGSLSLEGVLAYPSEREPTQSVLILAPHPHMGGNLDNNVVRHLARRVAEDGAVTLRFNYRGLGESTIELPTGLSRYDYFAEMEAQHDYAPLLLDAAAALDWLAACTQGIPQGPLIGYSLGAMLAGMMPLEHGHPSLIAISPPNKRLPTACFAENPLAKLFLGGGNDFAFDARALEKELPQLSGRNEFLSLPQCDHFFRGEEEDLFDHMKRFLFVRAEDAV